jgi:hypothetical protein
MFLFLVLFRGIGGRGVVSHVCCTIHLSAPGEEVAPAWPEGNGKRMLMQAYADHTQEVCVQFHQWISPDLVNADRRRRQVRPDLTWAPQPWM